MKEESILKKPKSVKDLAFGIAAYSSASILGPLVFFVVIGLLLDRYFNTKPIILIISIVLAFVTTNILLYKQIKKLIKKMDEIDLKKEENKNKDVKKT